MSPFLAPFSRPFLAECPLFSPSFSRPQVFESPLFSKVLERKRQAAMPFFDVLKRYPRNILLSMGARFAENVCFYIFTVVVLSYAKEFLKISESLVLNAVLIASAVHFFVIPAFGILSDRIGRRPVYLCGAAGLAVFAFPFFLLFDTGNASLMTLAITLGLVVHSAMYAPQAAFFSELFGTEVRYTGASIGYQLSAPLSGGLAPIISLALLEWSDGASWPVALYIIALSAITLVSVWLAAETHRAELGEEIRSSKLE